VEVEVGFQYRRKKGVEELYAKDDAWADTPLRRLSAPGPFTADVQGLVAGVDYEFRATVRHPLLTLFGEDGALPAGR
jgi:alpha-L-fucosidase